MVFEILRRMAWGTSLAFVVSFSAVTVLVLTETEIPMKDLWLHMAGSLTIGIYFGLASLLFGYERWSLLKQLGVHYLLSMAVYFPVAIGIGWIPLQPLALLLGAGLFTLTYAGFWFSIRWYLIKQANSMNKSVRR
ncbi:DUF3021 domain-containing protein [Paenibacillus pinihumi]|uniref:DUF3021 domain-containing protein n=1 Tax=Paenibacillus pinihumi TaxID=669462 RepID=UPI0003F792E3|nr:DUF3021 domain-containing protein [Paenibacillus pinihumi]